MEGPLTVDTLAVCVKGPRDLTSPEVWWETSW